MEIFDFYLENQREVVFGEVDRRRDFLFVSCGLPSRFFLWNFVWTEKVLNGKEIALAEEFFKSRGLRYSFCFEESEKMSAFKQILVQRGYEEKAAEEWLEIDLSELQIDRRLMQISANTEMGGKFRISNFEFQRNIECLNIEKFKTKLHDYSDECGVKIRIQKVEDEVTLERFLDVFYLGFYPEMDLTQPGTDYYYGYLKKAWYKNKNRQFKDAEKFFENFLLFVDEKPVGVASITFCDEKGYVSDVACLREFRGRGLGKIITDFCLKRIFDLGGKMAFLKTDRSENVSGFYEKLGFKKVGWTVYCAKRGLEKRFDENACLFLRPARIGLMSCGL